MKHIPKTRADEILRWLDEKVTPERAIAEIQRDEEHIASVAIPEPLVFRVLWFAIGGLLVDLFWRLVYGPRRTGDQLFADWLSTLDLSNAELWKYDTGGDSWEKLRGECGYAVIERGELVDFWMWFEN
ncbi:hypothetical protein [Novipirellula sp.]|uniref:hypothetical protein n=1 Tax=Novipirellula sp. TaxID=2795430 RepID=UPI003569C3D3